MKMRLFDRILLTIYSLAIIVASLFLIIVAAGIIPLANIRNYINSIEYGWDFAGILLIISLVFLLISIKLLFSRSKPKTLSGTLLRNTELGMIKISVNTLDALVQKSVKGFQEIKDVKSFVMPEDDGIRVRLNIQLMPDVNIPAVSTSVQNKVKEYVESTAGILVKEVYICIDNLAVMQRLRVE